MHTLLACTWYVDTNKLRMTKNTLIRKVSNGTVNIDDYFNKISLFGFRMAVKNACHMLMNLGIDSRSVYVENFEEKFLSESAEFYRVLNFSFIYFYSSCCPTANLLKGL